MELSLNWGVEPESACLKRFAEGQMHHKSGHLQPNQHSINEDSDRSIPAQTEHSDKSKNGFIGFPCGETLRPVLLCFGDVWRRLAIAPNPQTPYRFTLLDLRILLMLWAHRAYNINEFTQDYASFA